MQLICNSTTCVNYKYFFNMDSSSDLEEEEFLAKNLDEETEALLREENDLVAQHDLKCGEVFLGAAGTFTLMCAACLNLFEDLNSFGDHVHKIHRNLNKDFEYKFQLSDDSLLSSNPSDDDIEAKTGLQESGASNDLHQSNHPLQQASEEQASGQQAVKSNIDNALGRVRFYCGACKQFYKNRRSLTGHLRSQHNGIQQGNTLPDGRMFCIYCDRILKDASEHESHLKYDHPGDKKYLCVICGKTFLSRFGLSAHMRAHTDAAIPNQKSFPCPSCDMTYTRTGSLVRHINRIHKGIKAKTKANRKRGLRSQNPICRYCHKFFDNMEVFASHTKEEHSNRLYECRVCTESFNSNNTRELHHLDQHEGRPYSCLYCPKLFSDEYKFRTHIAYTHLKVAKHKCTYCDKHFKHRWQKLSHEMKLHNVGGGEKPFKCDECPKQFYAAHSLRAHKVSHSNDRPFVCDVCGLQFKMQRYLHGHKRIHTGLRNFLCNICGKGFVTSATLYCHKRAHRRNKERLRLSSEISV